MLRVYLKLSLENLAKPLQLRLIKENKNKKLIQPFILAIKTRQLFCWRLYPSFKHA